MNYLEIAKGVEPRILTWYHDLHQCPEVGRSLPQTRAYVCKCLEEMGIPHETFEDHSGIVAVVGKGTEKTVAVRADMDGLPVKEEMGCAYASKNGNMHACGHDAHTAIVLGLAKLLKEREAELKGTVKLLFQADEESLSGAHAMIQDGALKNPRPDRIYALHTGRLTSRTIPDGNIIIPRKSAFASSDVFKITVRGKAGHAATPHLAVDAVVIAAKVVEGVQAILSRELRPGDPAVITFTDIHSDTPEGSYNIVVDKVELIGGYRAVNPKTRERIRRRMEEIASGVAAAMGGEAAMEVLWGCSAVENDPELSKELMKSAEKILPAEKLHWLEEDNLGGEDAGAYFETIPGVYFFLQSCIPAEDGIIYPHHSSKFRLNEKVFHYGTAVLMQAIADYFG